MVSSGIEWGTSVKPLLAASYGNVSTTELLKLARSIQNGQEELRSHGPEYTAFYSSLVALSTHFLSGYVCNRWPQRTTSTSSRSDPLGQIVDILITPLSPSSPDQAKSGQRKYSGEDKETGKEESGKTTQEQFSAQNIQILIRLKAASVLLDLCLRLPNIGSFYKTSFSQLKRGKLHLPSKNTAEKDRLALDNSLMALSSEIDLVSKVLDLRLWETATVETLEKLSDVACSCLLGVGTHLIASHLPVKVHSLSTEKELELKKNNQDSDSTVFIITQQVVLQNWRCLESLCTGAVVQHLIANFEPSVGMWEFVQHFQSVVGPFLKDVRKDVSGKAVSVPEISIKSACSPAQRMLFLSRHVSVVPLLLHVASVCLETVYTDLESTLSPLASAPVYGDTMGTFGSVEMIDDPPMIDAEPLEPNIVPVNASTTEPSSDGEPLLGTWLEALLSSVPQLDDSKKKQSLSRQLSRRRSTATEAALLGGSLKDTPPSQKKLINVAADCLSLLGDRLFGGAGSTEFLRHHVSVQLRDPEISKLVSIIELLDRHDEKRPNNTLLADVSSLLTKMVHNLLVNQYLSDSFQDLLVERLVKHSLSSGHRWSLNLSCRVLSVFGQVMLLRLHRENEDCGKGSEVLVVEVWERFLKSLKDAVIDSSKEVGESSFSDVNVEHMQLLLVLFHSIPLIQRKAIFLTLVEIVIDLGTHDTLERIFEMTRTPHLGRLLCLLEYMMRFYYEPPSALADHVRSNIFLSQSQMSQGGSEKNNVKNLLISGLGARQYYPCSEVEDAWVSCRTSKENAQKPLFYNLCPSNWSDSDGPPKLCGLGVKVLLGSDKFDSFYRACIRLLRVGFIVKDTEYPTDLSVLSVHFIRSIAWRILGQLPVSYSWLNKVVDSDWGSIEKFIFIHLLRIICRFGKDSEDYKIWQKDWWLKQVYSEDEQTIVLDKVMSAVTNKERLIDACSGYLEKMVCSLREKSIPDNFYQDMINIGVILCTLRSLFGFLRVDSESTEKTTEGKVLSSSDISVCRVLSQLVSVIHKTANKLLLFDAKLRDDDFTMSESAVLVLLDLPTTSIQDTVPEATYFSFVNEHILPKPLTDSIEQWRENPQIIGETIFTSTKDTEVTTAGKNHFSTLQFWISGVMSSYTSVLLARWPKAVFWVTGKVLSDVQLILCEVVSKGQNSPFSLLEADRMFLSEIFGVVTFGHNSDEMRRSLVEWHVRNNNLEKLHEMENLLFLTSCFHLLKHHSSNDSELKDRCLLDIVKKISENVKRPVTWPAWATLCSNEPDLGEKLIKNSESEEKSPLVTMTWVDFLAVLCTQCQKPDGQNALSPVLRALVVPMLLSENLLNVWSVLLREKLQKSENCEAVRSMLEFYQSVNNLLSVNKVCSWATEAANISLEAIISVLASVRFQGCSVISGAEDSTLNDNDNTVQIEEEDSGEESVDEESLDSRLCTFTVTQKEFMNQHWYHCHTCSMVDGEGVCTVCAKVCHKDHDLSYSKFGSFFCDCGAKQDGTCLALTKRSRGEVKNSDKGQHFGRHVTGAFESSTDLPPPTLKHSGHSLTKTGRTTALSAFRQLKEYSRVYEIRPGVLSDEAKKDLKRLLLYQMGTQENVLENVKPTFTGDQAQTIRQLLQSHIVYRMPLTVINVKARKRQFLAMAHDKCKVTIFPLASLLKQAEISRKKLSLTRSAHESLPFNVVSLTSCEECLVVCGLKECHIYVIASSGSISDKLILQPNLETGNFIIKAVWLPDSSGQLAVVTADFVNIYDLRKDLRNPLFHFLLPAGKIRDISFAFWERSSDGGEERFLQRHLLIISSFGILYSQQLEEKFLFLEHGPFYVTNSVPLLHPELQESSGSVCGGGVSVYYSHVLQLLFLSYQNGKSFYVSFCEPSDTLGNTDPIVQILANFKGGDGGKEQALCRWSELPEHPGLLHCVNQVTSVPVLLYFDEKAVYLQEVSNTTVAGKSKPLDCIPIVQESSKGQTQTTLIVLCEDGSLQFYRVEKGLSFWSDSPSFPPSIPVHCLDSARQSNAASSTKRRRTKSTRTGPVVLPVDFFESCQQLSDIEFGGRDVLQFYNVQQLKNRLVTNNLWIACSKSGGFELEVVNKDTSMVVCGVRIELGKKSLECSPTFIEMFGRKRPTRLTRTRWYDIPLTRDESFAASNKFCIRFGPSLEGDGGIMVVDSVRIYGKSKDVFGWSEELEEAAVLDRDRGQCKVAIEEPGCGPVMTENKVVSDRQILGCMRPPYIPEIFLMSAFEVLDWYFTAFPNGNDKPKSAVDLATGLLCTTIHAAPLQKAKCVLRKLFPSKEAYYCHKDRFLLNYVYTSLQKGSINKDTELFAFLLMITRNIGIRRPVNLLQFTAELTEGTFTDSTLSASTGSADTSNRTVLDHQESFIDCLVRVFFQIHHSNPKWPLLASLDTQITGNMGLIVRSLVEVLHSYCLADSDNVKLAAAVYAKLLLSKDIAIGQACKAALSLIFRPKHRKKRVVIPSPPARCSTPGMSQFVEDEPLLPSVPPPPPPIVPENVDVEVEDEEEEENGGRLHLVPGAHQLEALLAAADEEEGLEALAPDTDDEAAMVELAIALSLQESGEGGSGGGAAQVVFHPEAVPSSQEEVIDAGHLSDTTGSGLSDEEGSTAATEGSTLRTSPAEDRVTEAAESGPASESGASGGESVSGRSSTYGEGLADSGPSMPPSDTGSSGGALSQVPAESLDTSFGTDDKAKLQALQKRLLEQMLADFPSVAGSDGGMRCVAYMQTILLLSSDLEESNRQLIAKLLQIILDGLDLSNKDPSAMCKRSPSGEIKLLKLRLLSVLLSKYKGSEKANISQADEIIATQTAKSLLEAGAIDYCCRALFALLDYWKTYETQKKDVKPKVLVMRGSSNAQALDLSPFFLRQYVKEHSRDIFECYAQLITEIALRLPCQIRKVRDIWKDLPPLKFNEDWEHLLCEFVSCQEAPFVRKQARKLLLIIAGSKEQYRFLRDQHTCQTSLDAVKFLCSLSPGQTLHIENTDRSLNLSYAQLNEMMDHLKLMADLASCRVSNWQRICLNTAEDSESAVLPFLLRLACIVNDVISQMVLTLILSAVCPPDSSKPAKKSQKPKPGDNSASTQLNTGGYTQLNRFGSAEEQHFLLSVFWDHLWPDAAKHGAKSEQLIDLIGYYSVKLAKIPTTLMETSTKLLEFFRSETRKLDCHPNANIYSVLGSVLECDGYYLEDNPCLVCNNPEVPMTNVKLSAVKQDSRFTTSSQIVKMAGSHEISKIFLKLTDIKRAKMIKQLNVFYSNKTVSSAVELKNKPEIWSLAKRLNLTPGQAEVKVEFPVPIVACNLMLDFADFYEAQKSGSELLHCPRCSATVPSNPGVCGNCGENVFQCHKCRSINYDEKDPFLCNSCGFSKYAKFELTLTARQIASVEPIENEEDRKKTLSYINTLLEKADDTCRHLQLYRSFIEDCIARFHGHEITCQPKVEINQGKVQQQQTTLTVSSTGAHRVIQEMSLRYTRDCKISFDELSRIIQRILANRTELLQYDCRHGEQVPSLLTHFAESSGKCFGCITAHSMHCVRLLRGLASVPAIRRSLCAKEDVLLELMSVIRRGPSKLSTQVKEFLCELCRDSPAATEFVCSVISRRVEDALQDNRNPVFLTFVGNQGCVVVHYALSVSKVHPEPLLERLLFRLFLSSLQSSNRAALEHVVLPCLQMIHWFLVPSSPVPLATEASKKTGKTTAEAEGMAISIPAVSDLRVNFTRWLMNERSASFSEWKKLGNRTPKSKKLELQSGGWLERALFCPSSLHVRSSAAAIFSQICKTSPERKATVLDILCKYVGQLSVLGERANEFFGLFRSLIEEDHWKYYLALRSFLPFLGDLMNKEVEILGVKEDEALGTDLTLGYSVRIFAELLQDFLALQSIRRRWKTELLGPVLHGYLALRRLIVQRTKLIDDAQNRLLALLEDITSGTESETRDFMAACITTVNKYPERDMRTPVFIFERLCSIISPEEKEVGEFLINIEKDPAQEDFLQGRMMGNPYSSQDTGMGPSMKDIKNKICRDCELIALLEDDTGMELLVNNKIISLELPVVEVYKKLWQPQHNGEAMLIMYRMRGLLGDATEEFVESLDTKKNEEVDDETVYRMAATMSTCEGLEAMLKRLGSIKNSVYGRSLLTVLLKLFGFCVKVSCNREKLTDPRLDSINTFLSALEMIIKSEDSDAYVLAECLLDVIQAVLNESSKLSKEKYQEFTETCGKPSHIVWLVSLIGNSSIMNIQTLKEKLMVIIPNLTLGSEERMTALIEHFKPFLDFNKFDFDPLPNSNVHLDSFCLICRGIQTSENGGKLKQKMLDSGFVKEATEYLQMHCPPLFKAGLTIDSPEWKEFLSKPGLKFALRVLAGLSQSHEPTQMLVAENCIPVVHRLEQISTEERLGSLAENLMESLRQNVKVAEKIEQVRQETKQSKKKMAMEMRRKQLEEMGMKMGTKGQVHVSTPKLKDAEDLHDESGLVCSICREGYKFQPQKVLGIYTYTKRVYADDFEVRPIKTRSYSTVTHFNVVHMDCHLSAVRSARGRDEWDSAMLHNANTLCNGLLPLWGPQVPESNFANCLARHNLYVQELTNYGDISFSSGVQDLKLLLLRFAEGKSFSEETGGGGKESNIQLIPCLTMLPLYQANTAKNIATEDRSLKTFIDSPPSEWVASSFTAEGPLFYCVQATLLMGFDRWKECRIQFLRRLLVMAQARNVSPAGVTGKLNDVQIKDWSVYKSSALFFGLVDGIYKLLYKDVKGEPKNWSCDLQAFLRENDTQVLESCKKLLKYFMEDLSSCESFEEFCDVAEILEEIPSPQEFLESTLNMVK